MLLHRLRLLDNQKSGDGAVMEPCEKALIKGE